jgi:hypothetical protein
MGSDYSTIIHPLWRDVNRPCGCAGTPQDNDGIFFGGCSRKKHLASAGANACVGSLTKHNRLRCTRSDRWRPQAGRI